MASENLKRLWRPKLEKRIFPAVPVPLDRDKCIDIRALESLIAYHAQDDFAGVALAHTTNWHRWYAAQRKEIYTRWREGIGPHRPIITAVGTAADPALADLEDELMYKKACAMYLERVSAVAEQMLELGADLIMPFAPWWCRGKPDQDERVREYFQRLSEFGAGMVLFLLYEEAGGIVYSYDLMKDLLHINETVAYKIATLENAVINQDVPLFVEEEFKAGPPTGLNGEDRMPDYVLMCGGKWPMGFLMGMASAYRRAQMHLMEYYYGGEAGAFLELAQHIRTFARATFCAPMPRYILRTLAALALQEVIPWNAVNDFDQESLSIGEIEAIRAAAMPLAPYEGRGTQEGF